MSVADRGADLTALPVFAAGNAVRPRQKFATSRPLGVVFNDHGDPAPLSPPVLPPGFERRLDDQRTEWSRNRTPASPKSPRRDSANNEPLKSKPKVKQGKMGRVNGVFGLLTLKEPSAAAWEKYTKGEKEKARQNGRRATTVGLPGVSTKKLPEHVPTVNSKWDGMPEAWKRQSAEQERSESERRASTSSRATTMIPARPSTTSAPTTVARVPQEIKGSLQGLSHRPSQSVTVQADVRPASSASVQRGWQTTDDPVSQAPPLTRLPPFRRNYVDARTSHRTAEAQVQTFLYPPSPSTAVPPQTFLDTPPASISTPELVPSDLDPGNESTEYASDEDALSPITPSPEELDLRLGGKPRGNTPKINAHARHPSSADSNATVWYSDSEYEDEHIRAPRSLRQPVNFSRRRARKPAPLPLQGLPATAAVTDKTSLSPTQQARELIDSDDEEVIVLSSTLKNSSGRIDPFLTEAFAAHSLQTGRITQRASIALANPPGGWAEEVEADLPTSPSFSVTPPASPPPFTAETYAKGDGVLASVALPNSPTFSMTPKVSPLPSMAESYFPSNTASLAKSSLPTSPSFSITPTPSPGLPTSSTAAPPHNPSPHKSSSPHVRKASTASASGAESSMDESWRRMSSKARLGFGPGQLRKSEVLPWETSEDITGNQVEVSGPAAKVGGKSEGKTEGRKGTRKSWRIGGRK